MANNPTKCILQCCLFTKWIKMDQKGMQRESSGALAATFVVVDGPDSAFPGERINSGPIWPY